MKREPPPLAFVAPILFTLAIGVLSLLPDMWNIPIGKPAYDHIVLVYVFAICGMTGLFYILVYGVRLSILAAAGNLIVSMISAAVAWSTYRMLSNLIAWF